MADISVAASLSSLNRIQTKEFSAGYQFGPPELPEPNIWLPEMANSSEEKKDFDRLDIWSSIQNGKQNSAAAEAAAPLPYIHPFARFSSCLMSQKSLEICTESLGSETGSDGFSSGDELDSFFSSNGETEEEEKEGETEEVETEEEEEETEQVMKRFKRELFSVNYHCSVGRRSPPRSFPPPLPSISRRDGPCLKMRPRRLDGRLVVEAVHVPSQNYLHAERHGGRLLLSFIDTSSFSNPAHSPPSLPLQQETEEHEFEEETEAEEQVVEEEVEVVDRGTIVEVKVSGLSAVKVHRSSLVINKFVVGSPLTAAESPPPAAKRASAAATTTAAAAAVAASSISVPTSTSEGFHYNYLHHHHNSPWGSQSPAAAAATDAKLLFTSKRLAREDLLHDMRRCSELRRPLFIFEQPHCIATSS